MKHKPLRSFDINKVTMIDEEQLSLNSKISKKAKRFLDWDDYNAPAALNHLQNGVYKAYYNYKPFSIIVNKNNLPLNILIMEL